MKKIKFLFLTAIFPVFISLSVSAQPIEQVDKIQNIAEIKLPNKQQIELEEYPKTDNSPISYASFIDDPNALETLLNQALYARQFDLVKQLLPLYRRFVNEYDMLYSFAQGAIAQSEQNYTSAINYYRQILAEKPNLNPVRIELAKALFLDKQDNNAREQFNKARTAPDVPPVIVQLIDDYLQALTERDSWQSSISVYYLNERNVNNTSSARNIENTGFVKGDDMLPKSAHGIAYNINIERDFNIINAHYLHVETELNGKSYWDNHQYDDVYNRSYLGYRYKTANKTLSILPFYERRWYGNHRYNWGNGIRAEYQHWITPNWQLSSALEWAKQHYFESRSQNGTNQLISTTLLWLRNPKQYFYLGADFNRERTQVKQYGSDIKGIRLGWGQEWKYGISSRLNGSISKRHFKDSATLGGILPLGKTRQDMIYSTSFSLWKRDWHILGITPKLSFLWKKQDSNLDSLYSYSEKQVRLIFEKNF